MVDLAPDPSPSASSVPTVPRKITAGELAEVIPTVMQDPTIQAVLTGVKDSDKQSLRDLDKNLRQVFYKMLQVEYGMDLIIAAAGEKVDVKKLKENWAAMKAKTKERLAAIAAEK